MPREQLTPEQMDNAAEAAREELQEMLHEPTPETTFESDVDRIADWWRKWYLLAGHKRLGRIIMGVK